MRVRRAERRVAMEYRGRSFANPFGKIHVLTLCVIFTAVSIAGAETVVFKNATVVDGTGRTRFAADLLARNGRIERVGRIESVPGGARAVDAKGLVLSPGFIDMHSHLDFQLPTQPLAENVVRQGVTTVVAGNCGFALAPQGVKASSLTSYLSVVGVEDMKHHYARLADYFGDLKRTGISVNLVQLAPHGMIREASMKDPEGKPSAAEMLKMKELLKGAMEDGAWGMSTGLAYPPGRGASTDEVIELMKIARPYGGLYATHIRDEGSGVIDAVKEAILIGEKAGVPVEISHVKTFSSTPYRVKEVLALMKDARSRGLDVTGDVYPYRAGSTSLSAIMMPPWVFREGNVADAVRRLREGENRKKAKEYIENRLLNYAPKKGVTKLIPDGTYLKLVKWFMSRKNVLVGVHGHPEYDGLSFAEIMEKRGHKGDVIDLGLDLLNETGHDVAVIAFMMSESDVRDAIASPMVMIGSDGNGVVRGGQHPRSFGAFPRVLARYVRKEGLLTLEQAVHKMSGMAASKLGLADRGVIREGARADLVLFDPVTVKDVASFKNPKRYPEGILMVMVNGTVTVDNGRHTGARAGSILKR
jgi:N-acyl-D-amino-acid deacylase